MHIRTPGFSLAEKLAIVNAIDAVILVDGIVHEGEITALSKLMDIIDFDSNFIIQARNIESEQGVSILKNMSQQKRETLAYILEEVALSDGFLHKKEKILLEKTFSSIGILQKAKSGS
mgnify:CR=1 FL=1